ncbi:hypothetical protein HOY82DRAFT_547725 [Tuber indicum]|nr:hypothetical protein HOY82DRAFT_547725 [Tuber indicum]
MQPTDQYIQPTNRSAWHNTYIFNSNDCDTVLGGLWVGPGITNSNLYSMVEILCTFTDSFDLQDSNLQLVKRDDQPLWPGNYYIVTNCSVSVSLEYPLLRMLLPCIEQPVESFRDSARDRDQRCVITGRPAVFDGVAYWEAFEAAHVFPLAYKEVWKKGDFELWINASAHSALHGTINSLQNGILLTREMHAQFVSYGLSINPDDKYKIVCFTPFASSYGIAGAHLDQRFLDNPFRPPDKLLAWHFRQAVLVNMKGVGMPYVELDVLTHLDYDLITSCQESYEKIKVEGKITVNQHKVVG